MKQGDIQTAVVRDEQAEALYVQISDQILTLPKEGLTKPYPAIGEQVEGMVYMDRNQQWCFQVTLPDSRLDAFGWGVVVDVRRDLGAFLDIGLVNKDVPVSLDELPLIQDEWPQIGDRLLVQLSTDRKNRLWANLAKKEEASAYTRKAPARLANQDIHATVYQLIRDGALAISTEGYQCFLHESEQLVPVRLGEVLAARVVDTHLDGSLNLSTRPRAHEALEGDATMILRILEKDPTGFLPLHDKSKPADIQALLGISKGQFKRAVGNLMKQGLIEQVKGEGLYLQK